MALRWALTVIWILSSTFSVANSKTLKRDVKALNEIKASLGWRVVYSWVGDDPCSDGDSLALNRNSRWNKLQDVLPPEIGELKRLTHLDVGNNHLVGTIRELIRYEGSFPVLRNLYLNNNYLTGGIPAQLTNLTNLEILHLSYNKMSGAIPMALASIPRLTYLYLDHNQFSGRIPDALYKHPFLKEMYNIEGNGFRPGVNPIGVHKVLELSDADFLV